MNRVHQIEKENEEYNRLDCIAHNCPNRWSVDAGNGRLCSAHAWADPMDWGRISSYESSKSLMGGKKDDFDPMEPLSDGEKRYILGEFKKALQTMNKDLKGWAHRLREREANGDALSLVQRKIWRDALGVEHDFA